MDSRTSWDTDEEQKMQEIYKGPSLATDTKHNKQTVIKYTKIPDYDQALNMWCERSQVRIRNYVTIDDRSDVKMTHSLRSELFPYMPNYTRRKVVRLEESDQDETSQAKSALKYIAKSNGAKKNVNTRSSHKRESTRTVFRSSHSNPNKVFHVTRRVKSPVKIKTSYNSVTTKSTSKKPCLKSIESNQELIVIDGPNLGRYPEEKSLKHIHNKIRGLNINNTTDIIYVPIEPTDHKEYLKPVLENLSCIEEPILDEKSILVEEIFQSAKNNLNDVQIETFPKVIIDKNTDTCIENLDFNCSSLRIVNSKKNDEKLQVNIKRASVECGSLCIPNVSLIDENQVKEFDSVSLPSLYVSHMEKSEKANKKQSECYKTPSYIISRATLTYTTKQKIDFHVVTNNEESATPPKLVASYPMNVVSVFKENKNKERQSNFKSQKNIVQRDINQNIEIDRHINVSNSLELVKPSEVINTLKLNNSFIHTDYFCDQFQKELNFIDSFFESLQYLQSNSITDKIIRKSITVSEDKLSLTKLHELTAHIYSEQALENLNSRIAQTPREDMEKVACKSLYLLNMLIKNEQRRAKNLLFVLKLREESLRDFTKSQILWLESKKKYENTDVSALKKKQRGALLKLQHECGEMQRIRKALLTLSEKRKSVLIRTKKNIEEKLNQMNLKNPSLHKKKRLKKNAPIEQNMVPLKCFDRSSSSEDTSSSKSFCDEIVPSTSSHDAGALKPYSEKYVQTTNEQRPFLKDEIYSATENCVTVDGSYLNILFHNLTLPEIFSSGRDYEVNKEALKNIIHTANNLRDTLVLESAVATSLIGQLKSAEKSKSSSPSTARSLVEEFDQYYKGYDDQDYRDSSPEKNMLGHATYTPTQQEECEVKGGLVQTVTEEWKENTCSELKDNSEISISDKEKHSGKTELSEMHKKINKDESHLNHVENSNGKVCAIEKMSSQVQLPSESKINKKINVATDPIIPEAVSKSKISALQTSVSPSKEVMGDVNEHSKSTMPLVPAGTPSTSEAEELMRQQIAIEREIKALEQQQSQLLVVREIPDKPPPPYTPPAESRPGNSVPKPFKSGIQIQKIVTEHFNALKDGSRDVGKPIENCDPFKGLVHNYCDEMMERMQVEKSDKPWHPYNLLPKRQQMTPDEVQKKIVADLKQALSGPPPPAPGPISRRGTDYIDDILFSEWPRCESEWTNLQSDEALVKNQVFESIFEKVLSDTISDFKAMFSPEPDKKN